MSEQAQSPKPERTGERRIDWDFEQGRMWTRDRWKVPVLEDGELTWKFEWRDVE